MEDIQITSHVLGGVRQCLENCRRWSSRVGDETHPAARDRRRGDLAASRDCPTAGVRRALRGGYLEPVEQRARLPFTPALTPTHK